MPYCEAADGVRLYYHDFGEGPAVVDDHISLIEAGLRTIDLIDLDYAAWHTSRDLPDQTSAKSLETVGKVVAEVVYRETP